MVDLIADIRHMMAESKFTQAQHFIEARIAGSSGELRQQLLPLYFEILKTLDKTPPAHLLLEHAEFLLAHDHHQARDLLELISPDRRSDMRYQIFQARLAEKTGELEELRKLISKLQLSSMEKGIPAPGFFSSWIEKYFKHDLSLKIQQLAQKLFFQDISGAESLVRSIILTCFERPVTKDRDEKFRTLMAVLASHFGKGQLEIYQNLLALYLHGFLTKKDYKKLAEAAIYFQDFPFQLIILKLMQNRHINMATEYAGCIRATAGYNFVYLSKHYPELKNYFIHSPQQKGSPAESWASPDLTLESAPLEENRIQELTETSSELTDHHKLIQLFKYQNYSFKELTELTVSFLQSQLPQVAVHVAHMCMNKAGDDNQWLQGAYLKLMSLMQLRDYRAVIDLSLEALTRARTKDDILSMMYTLAEAYLQIGDRKEARKTLIKIQKIDAHYRLTQERLAKLNEV